MDIAVIQSAAVMCTDDEEPDGFGIELLQHFTDGEEIAEAFGHLFVVHTHKTVVHPVAGKQLAVRTF